MSRHWWSPGESIVIDGVAAGWLAEELWVARQVRVRSKLGPPPAEVAELFADIDAIAARRRSVDRERGSLLPLEAPGGEWWSTRKASALLGVSDRQVRTLAHGGVLRWQKRSGALLVFAQDVHTAAADRNSAEVAEVAESAVRGRAS